MLIVPTYYPTIESFHLLRILCLEYSDIANSKRERRDHPWERDVYKRYAKMTIPAVMGTALLSGCGRQFMVLDPSGPVGTKEMHLILLSAGLMGIVIVPALILFAWILVRYRDKPGNRARFAPDVGRKQDSGGCLVGDSNHLDCGDWCVYSKRHLRAHEAARKDCPTFNDRRRFVGLEMAVHVSKSNILQRSIMQRFRREFPVDFVLTADAPINSFWVPGLGGQEYTMPGMALKLWLQADKSGDLLRAWSQFYWSRFRKESIQRNIQAAIRF